MNRDPIEEAGGLNSYSILGNNTVCDIDKLGLMPFIWTKTWFYPVTYYAREGFTMWSKGICGCVCTYIQTGEKTKEVLQKFKSGGGELTSTTGEVITRPPKVSWKWVTIREPISRKDKGFHKGMVGDDCYDELCKDEIPW